MPKLISLLILSGLCLFPAAVRAETASVEELTGIPSIVKVTPGKIELPKVTGRLTLVEIEPDNSMHLKIVLHGPDGKPLTNFDDDLTKLMHVIAIDDRFLNFAHGHVEHVASDGTAEVTLRMPIAAIYHIYVDCHPHGFDHQVLRFDVDAGHSRIRIDRPTLPPPSLTAQAGAYNVTLDTDTVPAGAESMIDIAITKDGKPATDLGDYLDMPAHVVMIDTVTLDYIHAHPMRMGGANALMLHTELPSPGLYRAWVQFMGGGALHVAAFTLTAQ